MTTLALNPTLQSLAITGVSGFMSGMQAGGIVSPNAAQAFTAIHAAIDEFFGSVTKHPVAGLQAITRGLSATGDVSPEQQARIMTLLKDDHATVDHILRQTVRFDASSKAIAGAAAVVGSQAPFDLGSEWRWIPPGAFLMGSRDDELYASSSDEILQGTFMITAGLYMLDHPVTNAEFKAFLSAIGCEDERDLPSEFAGDDQPAVLVTQKQATTYSQWLDEEISKKMGILVIGRLPTEPERMKAAKGPSGNEFITPAIPEQAHFNAEVTRVVNHPDAYANGYGLKDMIGNVQEWTFSTWARGSTVYVALGGSWDDKDPNHVRATYRRPSSILSSRSHGFRPILVPQY